MELVMLTITCQSLAIWSAVFMVLNWTFATAFIARPIEVADKIFYGGIGVVITIPLFFFVIYDFPRDHPTFYQIWLTCSVWMWGLYSILFMFLCGFYGEPHSNLNCGQKDFVGVFYYTTGLPTIALFGLGLKRLPAAIGAIVFFVAACPLVLVYKNTWYRNLLNFVIYHSFLLYVHYMREHAERRLYTLRDQLKVQFRATQKAQVNERKAADSKRRLTSYVFHEVRVPLNTALLAVQNMAADGTFASAPDIEFSALEGSLSMMSKVLNDVLDFNRMDSGRFETASRPFAFHQVMQSMFVPLRLATNARNLTVSHLA
jgi:osomolarity two-component system sensor histidine kinase SLN1